MSRLHALHLPREPLWDGKSHPQAYGERVSPTVVAPIMDAGHQCFIPPEQHGMLLALADSPLLPQMPPMYSSGA